MPTKLKQSKTRKNTTSITPFDTRKKTSSSSKPKKSDDTEMAQDNCKLTDKEIISDVLSCQKSLIKLYGTALCETSCPELRDLIGDGLNECAQDQFDAFLYMSERNMYPTDNAPSPKINQAKKKFSCCAKQMKN